MKLLPELTENIKIKYKSRIYKGQIGRDNAKLFHIKKELGKLDCGFIDKVVELRVNSKLYCQALYYSTSFKNILKVTNRYFDKTIIYNFFNNTAFQSIDYSRNLNISEIALSIYWIRYMFDIEDIDLIIEYYCNERIKIVNKIPEKNIDYEYIKYLKEKRC